MNKTLTDGSNEAYARLLRRPKSIVAPIAGRQPKVSFEFFPPKGNAALPSFREVVNELSVLNPAFSSVTYGAGGGQQHSTMDAVKLMLADGITTAAHLTCAGADRLCVDKMVMQFLEAGVKHIVALRGDPQDGTQRFQSHPKGYRNAADLVAGIRQLTGYCQDITISVAAYPEGHPEAPTAHADMDQLRAKFDAGANQAITQYFFSADTFLDFRNEVINAGIKQPVIPGILPVTNFDRVRFFSQKCGTNIPEWMNELFAGLEQSPDIRTNRFSHRRGGIVRTPNRQWGWRVSFLHVEPA